MTSWDPHRMRKITPGCASSDFTTGWGTLLRSCERLLHSEGCEVSCGILMRKRPELIAVEEELASQDQQPDPERETQGPAWDMCAEECSTHSTNDASGDELQQER